MCSDVVKGGDVRWEEGSVAGVFLTTLEEILLPTKGTMRGRL